MCWSWSRGTASWRSGALRGESTDYPLRTGCEFGCGSSIFAVSRDAPLALYCREGPLQGRTLDVREALTIGRGSCRLVTSTPSSRCSYEDDVASMAWGARNLISTALTITANIQKRQWGVLLLGRSGSTNGTYVRRVGPYAGPHRLRIGDKVLLGRTGLELCRFDVGVCSLKGARRTMEDARQSCMICGVAIYHQRYGPSSTPLCTTATAATPAPSS